MCGAPHSSGFVPFRPRAPVPEKRDDPIPHHHHHLTRSFCPKSKERERVEIPFYPTDPKPKRPELAGWITAERKRGGRARHGAGGRQGTSKPIDRPKALEVKPWPHTHSNNKNKNKLFFFFFAKRRTEEEHARRVEGKKSALHNCQLCEQQEYWVNKPKAGL